MADAGPAAVLTPRMTSGDTLTSAAKFPVDPVLMRKLKPASDSGTPPDEAQEFLHGFIGELATEHHRLIGLILQDLRIEERHIQTSGEDLWSLDGDKWLPVPGGSFMAGISMRPLFKLDGEWRDHIQVLLDNGDTALLATDHLREAERNNDARFRWIEATIAAELAVKETLIRIQPALEALILEVPSPPIRKLFGPLLAEYAGVKSPYVSQLHKGAETRNHLVHRPETKALDPQDVVDYVSVVGNAIRHLTHLCRVKMGIKETDLHWTTTVNESE